MWLKLPTISNPFQYKKGFSKVNSLFCTAKAIYDRVVFHIWPHHASKHGKIPMFKISRMEILQGKSSKERKVPMFILCEMNKFQHIIWTRTSYHIILFHLCSKHGKIPMIRCHVCKLWSLKSNIYEQGKVPLFKMNQRNPYILVITAF